MTFEVDEKAFRVAAEHVRFRGRLMEFAKESNRIEGITNAGSNEIMFEKLEAFLKLEKLTLDNVCDFNEWGILREMEGMNVRVGGYVAPPGGRSIAVDLEEILVLGSLSNCSPYETHIAFEELHPFTDGNGRTGRAIWLWQMVMQYDYDLSLGFLQKWYYQSLES